MIYIDTIYNPQQTKMLKYFKSKNIKSFNGLKYVYLSRTKIFLPME